MSFITRILREKAVYWPYEGVDDFGQDKFGFPVEINCRWSQKSELYLNATGEEVVSNAVVMVDRKLVLGSLLWHGKLEDLQHWDKPRDNPEAGEVKRMDEIPDRRIKEYVRKAFL